MLFDREFFSNQHEELKAFLEANKRRYTGFLVDGIVNVGSLDEPLFVLSEYYVTRFYWNGYTGSLRLTIYGRDEFFSHVSTNIFIDPELFGEKEFNYFNYPWTDEIHSPIQSIKLSFTRSPSK